MSVFAFGLGLSFATAPVRAIDAATGGRGSVAASLGALEIGGAALGAFAVGALHNDTPWPLALTVAGFALGAAAVYLTARPWR